MQKLSLGLCSAAIFSRIEAYEWDMDTMMALVTVPRILLGPAAGVFVDRYDRKKLIIFGDVVRGVSVLFIAFAAWNGFLEIWMVMLAAVISGICASVFNPEIESVLPDIVPSDNMIRANSAYQAATTGADVLGESLGGILYTVIGAPFMFLIDGISYLFSACTEVFLEIPKIERKGIKVTFREDFREGLRFIWKHQGVVRIIGMSFLINYLFGVIRVLIIPWFAGEEKLGMARYGILNGVQSIGLVAGMAISPLGNFAGGVLCVYADPRMLIVVHCAAAMIIAAALVVHPTVKEFFLQETEKRARSAAAEKDCKKYGMCKEYTSHKHVRCLYFVTDGLSVSHCVTVSTLKLTAFAILSRGSSIFFSSNAVLRAPSILPCSSPSRNHFSLISHII